MTGAGPASEAGVAIVFAGGVGLGAYQAGAFAAMPEALRERIVHVVGASIGAVNGALAAGNAPERRVAALEGFWDEAETAMAGAGPPTDGATGGSADGPLRRAASWLGAAQSRLMGRPGLFQPQFSPGLFGSDRLGLYSLAPLGGLLERLVDFDRLNDGTIRFSVQTTDLETGEAVVFDTARGDVLAPAHILASCGFVPEFEPVEIDGRLLGDAALSANAPVETALIGLDPDAGLVCFVLDLFARDAGRPRSLAEGAALRRDLLLGNPTHRALEAAAREDALRRLLARAAERIEGEPREPFRAEARRGPVTVLHLSHRSSPAEAGLDKQFDFSRATLRERRDAGAADMARALVLLDASRPARGFALHRVRR